MRIKKKFKKMYQTTVEELLKNNYLIRIKGQNIDAMNNKNKLKFFFLENLDTTPYEDSSKNLNEMLNADENTQFVFLIAKKGRLKNLNEYFQTQPLYYENKRVFEKKLKNCILINYCKNFKKRLKIFANYK